MRAHSCSIALVATVILALTNGGTTATAEPTAPAPTGVRAPSAEPVVTASPTTGLGEFATIHLTGAMLDPATTSVQIKKCWTNLQTPLDPCGQPKVVPVDPQSHAFDTTFDVRAVERLSSSVPVDFDCRKPDTCALVVFPDSGFPLGVFSLGFTPAPRFHPLPPARIADTRSDPGAWSGPLGPGQSRTLQVTGTGGAPASGVSAVTLNVTATNVTAASHLVVWPAASSAPDTSALNVGPGETVAALVTTALDSQGQVKIANNAGTLDVIVDISGWFDEGGTPGDSFSPVGPSRLFDSREGPNPARLVAGQPRTVPVTGIAGVPEDATAVAVTLTGVQPTHDTHLTAWPSGVAAPTASTLNLAAGEVRANAAVVPVGADGSIVLSTNQGATDVVLDVMGWFGPTGQYGFVAVPPRRVADTRLDPSSWLKPRPDYVSFELALGWGPWPKPLGPLLLNTTLVTYDQGTHLTAFGPRQPTPVASTVNAGPHRVAAAETFLGQDDENTLRVFNNEGYPDVVVDFVGYFV